MDTFVSKLWTNVTRDLYVYGIQKSHSQRLNQDFGLLVSYAAISIALLSYVLNAVLQWHHSIKAPVAGRRHFWEPAWVTGLRFARNSSTILRDGYEKFGQSVFKVRRNDCEVTVIPPRYVDELRDLKSHKLSATDAHVKNMVAEYTIGNVDLVRNSDLHRRVVSQRLTPTLGNLLPVVINELKFAFQKEIPPCEDWTAVRIHGVMVNVVARIFARLFVGPNLCRNDEWLQISILFTRNLSITRNILRLLPLGVRPLAARCLPTYWRIYSQLDAAEQLLGPIIQERRDAAARLGSNHVKPDDFLQWMMDDARQDEGSIRDLAHRQLLLSLASVHTTSLRVTHFFLDLCAFPEYLEPLRVETRSVLREDGGIRKTTLNKLHKLDSFLKEPQRMHPMLALTFQRVVKQQLTLKDGLKLPKGTHIAVAAEAIGRDPAVMPDGGDPNIFDPFRYARLREDPDKPENINRYQFATKSSADMHFGHGLDACPGRFFASNEIKLILVFSLLRYDFDYPKGQKRPRSFCYDKSMVPDTNTQVLVRRRQVEQDLRHIIETI
ncbi:hypothetical protein PTNB85_03764 [Pyrenophora teres f. teres]|uniref:CypX n=1 Tax=Pyrenophora teres f. teres TaxID=97479 RepID=A0A6S6W1H9_9PLEO|nr:hypothetical protein HRS9139_05682 [Pyrenophora teres f. teres]KAE8840365.1 hypothetical protein PTNB85_03764 [Pyrenophora teres f. teres]KAE8863864.1 hypothetical protein PTNB29_03828 [Pyrenophora teres f. teres]CAE7033952.1 CypX [Pyrenophora teres f. teres]